MREVERIDVKERGIAKSYNVEDVKDERARIVSVELERIYEHSGPGLHALRFVLRVRHSMA